MSPNSKLLFLSFCLSLALGVQLLAAPAAVAKPACGDWGASTSQGKKEKTIDGVKHVCDASSRSRSCCEYGQQTKCWNETQTTYDNCTPAQAVPGKSQLNPKLKDRPALQRAKP